MKTVELFYFIELYGIISDMSLIQQFQYIINQKVGQCGTWEIHELKVFLYAVVKRLIFLL